jgi:hypothetical protein
VVDVDPCHRRQRWLNRGPVVSGSGPGSTTSRPSSATCSVAPGRPSQPAGTLGGGGLRRRGNPKEKVPRHLDGGGRTPWTRRGGDTTRSVGARSTGAGVSPCRSQRAGATRRLHRGGHGRRGCPTWRWIARVARAVRGSARKPSGQRHHDGSGAARQESRVSRGRPADSQSRRPLHRHP